MRLLDKDLKISIKALIVMDDDGDNYDNSGFPSLVVIYLQTLNI
jgi:hypothetical protein